MAVTYKYQQNFFDGSSKGYVKFNVTPDIYSVYLAAGETFTITGQAFDSTQKPLELSAGCSFSEYPGEEPELGRINVTASKGSAFTFTMRCTLQAPSDATSRRFSYIPYFTIWGTGGGNGTVASQTARGLTQRAAPIIRSLTLEDTDAASLAAGTLVQKHSVLRYTSSIQTDGLDPDTVIASRTIVIGGKRWSLTGASELLPDSSNYAGETDYTFTVTDNRGMSASTSGKLYFTPYFSPFATDFSIERYATVTIETGEVIYELDDESPTLWLNLEALIAPVNGKNAWSAVVSEGTSQYTADSGSDGRSIAISQDRSIIPNPYSESKSWTFTLTLRDSFETVTYTFVIPDSTAILDVERTGVAVGMRSGGTLLDPLFEVAYPAIFNNGIFDGDGNAIGGTGSIELGERVIGTCFGKALYRKVVTVASLSTSSSSPSTIDIGITPSSITNIAGYVMTNSYGNLPLNCYHSASIRAFARPDGLTGKIVAYAGTGCANKGAVLIVDYTVD